MASETVRRVSVREVCSLALFRNASGPSSNPWLVPEGGAAVGSWKLFISPVVRGLTLTAEGLPSKPLPVSILRLDSIAEPVGSAILDGNSTTL